MNSVLTTLVVVGGLTACSLITSPLPPGAEQFVPPAVYARWWAMTEACSGHSGDLGAIHWFRVPGVEFMHNGQSVGGYYNQRTNRIVLVEEGIEAGRLVRHEMLHALLQQGGHPRSQFLGSCASLVDCPRICSQDVPPWRPPQQDYAILPPESLDVASRGELLPPESDGERWLTLEVTVRNPRSQAALVAAPGNPVTPTTFEFDLRGPLGGISAGEVATDSSTLFFKPLESKRLLFEFRVASQLSYDKIPPGNYLVRGGYARRWSAYETIAVSP
jgi:hypothetical protein